MKYKFNTINVLEENIVRKISDIPRSNILIDMSPKARDIKKILEDFKKDIDSNTIIVGDFNTTLSIMDRSSK